jgi:hypothetical protein
MALFAFLYHPTRALSAEERAERSKRVPPWALDQREKGRVVSVLVLDDAGSVLQPEGEAGPIDGLATAGCTLVEARDMADALELAAGFPGRAFGTAIEVRPVTTFLPPPAQAAG